MSITDIDSAIGIHLEGPDELDILCTISINGVSVGPGRKLWEASSILMWLREAWPELTATAIARVNPAPVKKPRKRAKKK